MVNRIIIIILLLFAAPEAMAQKFVVPLNYQLHDEQDYLKYQPDVLKAIDWFQQTPWNEKRLERTQVSEFLMAWIEGCPYVTVETSDDINELGDNNNDLLVAYLGGYTKYLLLNSELSFKNDARMAGMKALFAKYEKDKAFKSDKKVEELMNLDQKALQDWLSAQLDDGPAPFNEPFSEHPLRTRNLNYNFNKGF
ncbi:MAG: hypothetical protein ABIN91_07300 [Mucilaginibacter sp.]|uniref:hypothetical protein n=1 Tax=Mucilaginibacter sp. TaxID=1882438 RepID=UPI0032674288